MSALHSIIVKKYLDIINEYVANAAITPGMLVELMSTGKIRKHATASGNAEKTFAIEDALQGKGVDDHYAADDIVRVWSAVPGEVVYAIIADGQTIGIGDKLVSDGLGCLTKCLDDSDDDPKAPLSIIGVALEAINLALAEGSESSAGGTYYPRIKVRIV
jgi:hypothetical protein